MAASKKAKPATQASTSRAKPVERKKVRVSVRTQVLTEAGYRCAVPTCRTILALDLHHMYELSEGGGDTVANLIALCPTCHALYHRGDIKRESVQAWKAMLIALNGAFDRESVDLLLMLDKIAEMGLGHPLMISSDALLRFASLISTDLVTFTQGSRGVFRGPESICYVPCLSVRGSLLVDAWKRGDRSALGQLGPGNPTPRKFSVRVSAGMSSVELPTDPRSVDGVTLTVNGVACERLSISGRTVSWDTGFQVDEDDEVVIRYFE